MKVSIEEPREYDWDDNKLHTVKQLCSNKLWNWEQCQLEEEVSSVSVKDFKIWPYYPVVPIKPLLIKPKIFECLDVWDIVNMLDSLFRIPKYPDRLKQITQGTWKAHKMLQEKKCKSLLLYAN